MVLFGTPTSQGSQGRWTAFAAELLLNFNTLQTNSAVDRMVIFFINFPEDRF